jgi:hypothetical protein
MPNRHFQAIIGTVVEKQSRPQPTRRVIIHIIADPPQSHFSSTLLLTSSGIPLNFCYDLIIPPDIMAHHPCCDVSEPLSEAPVLVIVDQRTCVLTIVVVERLAEHQQTSCEVIRTPVIHKGFLYLAAICQAYASPYLAQVFDTIKQCLECYMAIVALGLSENLVVVVFNVTAIPHDDLKGRIAML